VEWGLFLVGRQGKAVENANVAPHTAQCTTEAPGPPHEYLPSKVPNPIGGSSYAVHAPFVRCANIWPNVIR